MEKSDSHDVGNTLGAVGLVWMTLAVLGLMVIEARGQRSKEMQCDQNIESHTHRNGTISSPYHPGPYPAGITCLYNFTGVGRERVQLRFLHLDLAYPKGDATNPIDCKDSDSVSVYIFINGQQKELNSWCGLKLPPMLMSNQPKMLVHFRSNFSSPTVTGFKAEYSFVTNFGIHEGQQDNRGTCAFNYQSSVKSSGVITSPNYIGLYPRNTECHYLFYGRGKERVQIIFEDFDVDGLNPSCEESTQSDYVTFSNFADTEDRKMTRLCGKPPMDRLEIWSDGPFFRVTFKSNDIYDSTGFKAVYRFKGIQNTGNNPNTPVNDRSKPTFQVQDNHRNSGHGNSLEPCTSKWSSAACLLYVTFMFMVTL